MFYRSISDHSRVVSEWHHNLESHLNSSIMLLVLSFTLLIFYATGPSSKVLMEVNYILFFVGDPEDILYLQLRPQPIHFLIDLIIYGMHI